MSKKPIKNCIDRYIDREINNCCRELLVSLVSADSHNQLDFLDDNKPAVDSKHIHLSITDFSDLCINHVQIFFTISS